MQNSVQSVKELPESAGQLPVHLNQLNYESEYPSIYLRKLYEIQYSHDKEASNQQLKITNVNFETF